MKGYRTIAFGLLLAIAPAGLSYLAGIHWTDIVGPEWGGVIVGIIVILLRMVTTTPVLTNTSTIVKILIAALALSLFLPRGAVAGDINAPAVSAINKALNSNGGCVAAGNCSGTYWDFALENNANLGGVVSNGSGAQLGIDTGVGYQLWKNSWLAGLEVNGGYQPGTGGATGTFTSTQFVKLGYNFFTSTQLGATTAPTGTPAASQNPFLNLVPANILANSTPAIIAGGCFAHAVEKACAGLEIDSVIAAGWTTAFQYYNAPSVKGQPDESVFRIMVQKHL